MTEEEIRRMKYRNLRRNLTSIRSKVNNLQMNVSEVESNLKQTVLIDNKIVEEEAYGKIKRDISSVSSELNTSLIPMVNNKC